jgi:hypothetical protein
MAGQNTLIIANDYNVIQSKIALVLGSGSGNKGYGQTISSSQVGQYSTITVSQWSALRDDIARARQHQTGVTLGTKAPEDVGYVAGSDLPIPNASKQVKDTWRAAYLSVATDADTNYLTAPPPSGQASRVDLVTQQIRNTPWNGTITQSIAITWATADDARYFFNTGSQIEFSADRSGGSPGLKNGTWTAMLSGMGTIAMNHTQTTCTGTGVTSSLGFYDLTTTNGVIFEKDAPTGAYTPNKYYIYARVNDTGANRRILYFDIVFGDDSPAPPSVPDPGFGIDENVDGTLTSTVQVYRASGTNVSVPTPSAVTTAIN